jgi:hypothetical protein
VNRKIKIIVDVLMVAAVVASYIRWEGSAAFHVISGAICSLLFAMHFCLNRKAFAAFGKAAKKRNKSPSFDTKPVTIRNNTGRQFVVLPPL